MAPPIKYKYVNELEIVSIKCIFGVLVGTDTNTLH